MYGYRLHLISKILLLIQSYKDQGEKILKTEWAQTSEFSVIITQIPCPDPLLNN